MTTTCHYTRLQRLHRSTPARTLAWFLIAVLGALSANAAEVRLKPAAEIAGPIVRLGDLAEIDASMGDERQRLASVELGPAPLAGRPQLLRSRDLLDRLQLLGVEVDGLTLTGAPAVLVRHAGDAASAAPTSWQQAVGGASELPRYQPPPSPRRTIQAVAAARPIRRGETLAAGDLQLVAVAAPPQHSPYFEALDDVVGQQTQRPLAAGQPVEASALRPPVVVERNEVVTLVVRAQGVSVSTQVRALEQGAVGDVISVQSLYDRHKYTVRVAGVQLVEMLAGSPRAESLSAESLGP